MLTLVNASAPTLTADQRSTFLQILIDTATDDHSWVGVHAAEDLITLGRLEDARKAYLPQIESTQPQYRIGVWRVLARSAPTPELREQYITRIRNVLLDPAATDHTHAIETLGKLAAPITSPEERKIVESLTTDLPSAPYAYWRLLQNNDPSALAKLKELTKSDDATARGRAHFVLARLPGAAPATRPASGALSNANHSARHSAAMALADVGAPSDIPSLLPLIKDEDADVRVAAAFAMLSIDARSQSTPEAKP